MFLNVFAKSLCCKSRELGFDKHIRKPKKSNGGKKCYDPHTMTYFYCQNLDKTLQLTQVLWQAKCTRFTKVSCFSSSSKFVDRNDNMHKIVFCVFDITIWRLSKKITLWILLQIKKASEQFSSTIEKFVKYKMRD